MSSEVPRLSVEQFLKVARRRAPLIVAFVFVFTAIAVVYSVAARARYTATASLVFNNQQLGQQVAGLQALSNSSNALADQATNLDLVQLGDMASKTATRLRTAPGASNEALALTTDSVRNSITASAQGESNIVDVSAVAGSPQLAAEIANTYVSVFVNEQQNANHAYYASALALVRRQLQAMTPTERVGAAGLALQDRLQSLSVLANLKDSTVQVAQLATPPTSPSSPKTVRNIFLGLVAGLLLGIGIAVAWDRLDRRIRDPDDLAELYDLPLLGVVAESRSLLSTDRRALERPSAADEEAFQLIWAHLRYFNVDREVRALLVTSAAPGDGKTTVSRHLASAAARRGAHVLLIEADLRRPVLAQRLAHVTSTGLAEVLIGAATLDEATWTLDADDDARQHGGRVDVLQAGPTLPPNPGELIESQAMEALLLTGREEYDVVIVDTPPLTAVSDAFPLLRNVDGVVVVGRIGRNRRDDAARLRDILNGVGSPVLGVIANGVRAGSAGYGYGYGYGYTEPANVSATS